jgi:hypothetical protein
MSIEGDDHRSVALLTTEAHMHVEMKKSWPTQPCWKDAIR